MAHQDQSLTSKKDYVLTQIEAQVQTLLQNLVNEEPLFIKLRKSAQAAWRLAVVLRTLDVIHKALVDDSVISKRDVFYQDPDLFESQAVVDKYVDKIAMTFGVSRDDLNVVAEVRGLVAGAITDSKNDTLHVDDTSTNPEGLPVPRSSQLQHLLVLPNSGLQFLLLIEKRATFHALSRSGFHKRHKCILLTGQGYPDLATRAFLHHFHYYMAPGVPCYALVDFDPDGLSIYNVYTRGSQALSHENNVSVPELRLLGLKSEDALMLLNKEDVEIPSEAGNQDKATTNNDERNNDVGLAYLSKYERRRAKGLLKRVMSSDCYVEEDVAKQKYIQERWNWQESEQQTAIRRETEALLRELQVCLIMGYKVEIQILDRRPGELEGWILEKMAKLA